MSDRPKLNPEILAFLASLGRNEWDTVLLKVGHYAAQWRMLVGHVDAVDVTSLAILSLFDGSRRWRPEHAPTLDDLIRFLKSVVKSIVSHQRTSAESRRRVYLSQPEDEWGETGSRATQSLQHKQSDRELFRLVTRAVQQHKDSESLLPVVSAIEACDGSIPEMAKHLRLEYEEVRRRVRKIERALIRHLRERNRSR